MHRRHRHCAGVGLGHTVNAFAERPGHRHIAPGQRASHGLDDDPGVALGGDHQTEVHALELHADGALGHPIGLAVVVAIDQRAVEAGKHIVDLAADLEHVVRDLGAIV